MTFSQCACLFDEPKGDADAAVKAIAHRLMESGVRVLDAEVDQAGLGHCFCVGKDGKRSAFRVAKTVPFETILGVCQ